MPDAPMIGKAGLLAAALLSSFCGTAWLALAMEPHWHQVRGPVAAGRNSVRLLRVLGAAAWLTALGLCLRADHATMAVLVWVMALAGSALLVTFSLSWRPRWLLPLVAWIRPGIDDR